MQTTFNIIHLEKKYGNQNFGIDTTETIFADKETTIPTEQSAKKVSFFAPK
jgi:hypothetical protein